jgi:GAF domain-containing protein
MRGAAVDTTLTLAERLERIDRLAADVPSEYGALRGELQALREDVVQYEAGRHALHGEILAREAEVRRLGDALADSRRRGADTASLYVAAHRLHGTLDRGQVLQALEEVVASLLGCEEMAVFELIGTPPVLAPARTVGIEPGTLDTIQPGVGMIGQVAVSGEAWVAGHEPWIDAAGRPLTACIPLKVDGQVTGALALYRLLEHKGRLQPSDLELLDLLGTHAGTALCATRLRMRFGAGLP